MAEPSPAPPAHSWRHAVSLCTAPLHWGWSTSRSCISVSAGQEPVSSPETLTVYSFQHNYPYFLDRLRKPPWSPPNPAVNNPLTLDPTWATECLYLGLLHSTEIYSHLIRVHFSPPHLDYEFSASEESPIHLCLTLNDFALEKSTLFFFFFSIWFLHADSETKISSGSLQLTFLIGDSNYRKLREATSYLFSLH